MIEVKVRWEEYNPYQGKWQELGSEKSVKYDVPTVKEAYEKYVKENQKIDYYNKINDMAIVLGWRNRKMPGRQIFEKTPDGRKKQIGFIVPAGYYRDYFMGNKTRIRYIFTFRDEYGRGIEV